MTFRPAVRDKIIRFSNFHLENNGWLMLGFFECLLGVIDGIPGPYSRSLGVPRRFQVGDLQDRLSLKASSSQQPGVTSDLKAYNARSLRGGNNQLACD